ncbi:hypothetical protein SAMN02910409_2246 [Prevotellaceae bacterium HUN156]|nr:hypothetical protein SAMN02910409_2246 [Prevotellaceae bacterium HUN156]
MSNYYIYLKMPSYLRQWFIHRHGGSNPVNLIRGSIESKLLQKATVPPPPNVLPHLQQPDEVAICIPYSKSHDPRIYNHITETGKNAMIARIKDDFALELWDYLHDFGKIGSQQKDLIYLFMEQHGIHEDGTCWDAIAKIYQRQRNIYLTKIRRKNCTTSTRFSGKI